MWAGGNGGYDDNCNCDGYVNSIFTIGINTVSQQHSLLGDAERCSAIMTTAFSGEPGQFNSIVSRIEMTLSNSYLCRSSLRHGA